MYPDRELRQLALHKAALRREIALSRCQCVTAAARVAQPFAWLDRALAFWRKISPMAKLVAIPAAMAAGKAFLPRMKTLGTILRWAPAVIGAVQSFRRK